MKHLFVLALSLLLWPTTIYAQPFTDTELKERCAPLYRQIEQLNQESIRLHAGNSPREVWIKNDDDLAMAGRKLRACRLTGLNESEK